MTAIASRLDADSKNNTQATIDEAFHKKQYPFLDSLRAISIFAVILHHVNYFFLDQFDFGVINGFVHRLMWLGFLGVDVFFVISGFLITNILIDEFLSGRVNIKRFYARRFFKIYPHYFFILLISFCILIVFESNVGLMPKDFLSYLLLFHNYLPPKEADILAHTWSLCVEEHFYLVYPILLFFIGSLFKSRLFKLIGAITFLILLLIFGNVLRFIEFQTAESFVAMNYQATHLRFDALVFGCFLRFCEPCLRVDKNKLIVSIASFLVTSFLCSLFFIEFKVTVWFYFTLAYLAVGALIISGLNNVKPLVSLGNNPLLVWIGKRSYGIYLWHYILIFPILNLTDRMHTSWIIVVSYVLLSISLGALSTVTVERYFLNLRNKLVP